MATGKIKRGIPIVLLLSASLVCVGLPTARARSRAADYFYGATDAQTGATGGFTFHFDDDGQLQYITGIAETANWSTSAWWTPTGDWTFYTNITDPSLADLPVRGFNFGTSSFDWNDPNNPDRNPGPTPGPIPVPIVPPAPAPTVVTCPECIDKLRQNCRLTFLAEGAVAVGAGAGVTHACLPAGVVTAPPPFGGSFAVCAIAGLATTGFGTWLAKLHMKACWDAAPLTCTDPTSGTQCIHLGWQ